MKLRNLARGAVASLFAALIVAPVWAHPGHDAIGIWHHVTDFAWPILALVLVAWAIQKSTSK